MVRIDEEIKKVISQIKSTETKEILHQVKIESTASDYSIAG